MSEPTKPKPKPPSARTIRKRAEMSSDDDPLAQVEEVRAEDSRGILEAARNLAIASADSPIGQTARRLAERQGLVEGMFGGTAGSLQEIIERSEQSARHLRAMLPSEDALARLREAAVRAEPIRYSPPPPRPEVEAAWTIQQHLPALVELQAKSFDQTAALATIAKADLEEAQELRRAIAAFTDQARASSESLNLLTVVLVVLTVVLVVSGAAALYIGVAAPLELWPFDAASRP